MPDHERHLAWLDERLRAVFRACVAGESPWPLYLHGPAGCGKTTAALVLLDHCGPLVKGKFSVAADIADWAAGYVEVRQIPRLKIDGDKGVYWLSEAGRTDPVSWPRMLRMFAQAPLAVVDEIGVVKEVGDFRLDSLIEVLNVRQKHPVKPFVVTGNLAPSELERVYDDRVASRVLCGTVYFLDGADRRLRGW